MFPFLLILKSDLWPKYFTCDDKSFTTSIAKYNPGLSTSASSACRYHWKQQEISCLMKTAFFSFFNMYMKPGAGCKLTYTVIYKSNLNSLFGDLCLGYKPVVATQKPHEGLGFAPPFPWPQLYQCTEAFE